MVAREFYIVVNPAAVDYRRVCLLIGVVTKDDDPDIHPCRVVRFPDGSAGAFWQEELKHYER